MLMLPKCLLTTTSSMKSDNKKTSHSRTWLEPCRKSTCSTSNKEVNRNIGSLSPRGKSHHLISVRSDPAC